MSARVEERRGEPVRVGSVTLVPVVRVVTLAGGGFAWLSAEPVAVEVRTPEGVEVVDLRPGPS